VRQSPRAHTNSTTVRRAAGAAVLLGGAAVAAVLVLFPSGWAINRLNVSIWWWLKSHSLIPAATTPEQMDATWNIVLFVPLGLGLTLLHPRWWWAAVLVVVSVLVEGAQFLFLEQRTPEGLDIALNAAGGAIGTGVGAVVARLCEKRTTPSIDSSHG
jgi:glycopeptide antibiotics resistance protein